MVARRVEEGALFLHGWHYSIEDGQILVFDAAGGRFVPHAEYAGALPATAEVPGP
jgi:carbonic anhydrase